MGLPLCNIRIEIFINKNKINSIIWDEFLTVSNTVEIGQSR